MFDQVPVGSTSSELLSELFSALSIMPGEETVITMGGRRGRKVSKVLSLHVENEARTHSLRRRRAPVCLSPLTPLNVPQCRSAVRAYS